MRIGSGQFNRLLAFKASGRMAMRINQVLITLCYTLYIWG